MAIKVKHGMGASAMVGSYGEGKGKRMVDAARAAGGRGGRGLTTQRQTPAAKRRARERDRLLRQQQQQQQQQRPGRGLRQQQRQPRGGLRQQPDRREGGRGETPYLPPIRQPETVQRQSGRVGPRASLTGPSDSMNRESDREATRRNQQRHNLENRYRIQSLIDQGYHPFEAQKAVREAERRGRLMDDMPPVSAGGGATMPTQQRPPEGLSRGQRDEYNHLAQAYEDAVKSGDFTPEELESIRRQIQTQQMGISEDSLPRAEERVPTPEERFSDKIVQGPDGGLWIEDARGSWSRAEMPEQQQQERRRERGMEIYREQLQMFPDDPNKAMDATMKILQAEEDFENRLLGFDDFEYLGGGEGGGGGGDDIDERGRWQKILDWVVPPAGDPSGVGDESPIRPPGTPRQQQIPAPVAEAIQWLEENEETAPASQVREVKKLLEEYQRYLEGQG